jgi:hypothetical protein
LELFLEEKPDTLPKAGFRELVLAGIRNRRARPSLEALWEIWLDGQTARFCTKCGIPAPPGQRTCPGCESAEHLRPIEP